MLFTPVLLFVTVLINLVSSSPVLQSTGDCMFYTPVSMFVIVLMIYPVSSSLTHAPIPKDPSVHIAVEYTREAEIESAY